MLTRKFDNLDDYFKWTLESYQFEKQIHDETFAVYQKFKAGEISRADYKIQAIRIRRKAYNIN